MRRLARLTGVGLFLVSAGAVHDVAAQQVGAPQAVPAAPVPNDSTCAYRSCALTIKPAWDGLAVVRGVSGQRLTTLHFFWPRDITAELRGADSTAAGADSAAAHAARAVTLRRAGAGFTDLGLLTFGVAIARSVRDGRFTERNQVLAGAALGAVVVSIPLQFAADGELSRAVWWHNVRFAR